MWALLSGHYQSSCQHFQHSCQYWTYHRDWGQAHHYGKFEETTLEKIIVRLHCKQWFVSKFSQSLCWPPKLHSLPLPIVAHCLDWMLTKYTTFLSSSILPSTVNSSAIGWPSLITSQLSLVFLIVIALTVISSTLDRSWVCWATQRGVSGDFGGGGHAIVSFCLLW